MIFRIVEHCSAHAVLSLLAHQDFVVHAALTTCPEGIVLCEFRVSDRLISQITVDLHYSEARGKTKDLCFRIFLAAQCEYLLLDRLCQPAFAESRGNDQSGVGYIFAMAPCFDITETCPDTVLVKGDDGFSFFHFFLDIFWRS